MLKMLSEYTHHMEELVRQRESELITEKKQVEDMLYSILPRFISSHHCHHALPLLLCVRLSDTE